MDYRQFQFMNPYQPYPDQLAQLRNSQYVPPQNAGGSINWVQGESGAKAWLINPGTSVLLMDSETQRFYIKTSDTAGMPTMRVFEYKEITGMPVQEATQNSDSFVTRKEFEELRRKLDELSEPVTISPMEARRAKSKGGSADESSV